MSGFHASKQLTSDKFEKLKKKERKEKSDCCGEKKWVGGACVYIHMYKYNVLIFA